ncbi:MAG: hypothetical protein VKJ06_01615 [Vampirovibrionales bacterium]|nr:hypothetical protein [Vampirovibrionales bacterium]
MARFIVLASGATAASRPDPNLLATTNPEWSGPLDPPGAAWQSQGSKALFPLEPLTGGGDTPMIVALMPGAGVTSVDISAWFYVDGVAQWLQFNKNTPTLTLTQKSLVFIENPSGLPCYIQLSNFVGGTTASLYADAQTAQIA